MREFPGKQYLQIDVANNFGLDKLTWEDRLSWFEDNKDKLHDKLNQADEPALYYSGVRALEAVERKEPIGYMVSLDATSSGLQLLSCLTGDLSAAKICNVVNNDGRADAYTIIYQHMLDDLGGEAKIKRDDCKSAIMKSLYGSKKVPKDVFGDGTPELYAFYEVMKEHCPAAWELNEMFLKIWDPTRLMYEWVLPDNFHVKCKVMSHVTDRVHVNGEPIDIIRKINAPIENGRSLGANSIHSLDGMVVREITRRCDYDVQWINLVREVVGGETISHIRGFQDKVNAVRMVEILWDHYQMTGYLSARILDYIDSETIQLVEADKIQGLLDSLPKKPFKVVSNHDCFRCLPHYMNDLRKQYNLQLYHIARSDILTSLFNQLLLRKDVQIGKYDSDFSQAILHSEYALS